MANKKNLHGDRSEDGLDRRTLLLGLITTLTAMAADRGAWSMAGATSHRGLPIRDWSAARRIGERYLALRPDEADIDLLRSQLGISLADTARNRARLASLRHDEFSAGQTVLVDGWIVSQSEARLCALAVLV